MMTKAGRVKLSSRTAYEETKKQLVLRKKRSEGTGQEGHCLRKGGGAGGVEIAFALDQIQQEQKDIMVLIQNHKAPWKKLEEKEEKGIGEGGCGSRFHELRDKYALTLPLFRTRELRASGIVGDKEKKHFKTY